MKLDGKRGQKNERAEKQQQQQNPEIELINRKKNDEIRKKSLLFW